MKIFIIAEAGVNHNGNLQTAFKLIDEAKSAGADAVKFQTFKADDLVCKNAPKADYQVEGPSDLETQFEMLKKLELDDLSHEKLFKYAIKKDIMFLSTPFDLKSADKLYSLGIKIFKLSSGDITNFPLLKKVGRMKKEVILSSGMSSLSEIEYAIGVLTGEGTRKDCLTVLHCNTAYPTPMEDVNLRAMLTIKEKLDVNVGYSDHTPGVEVPIAASALGATVIEKHFTLSSGMEGPDHKASVEPDELKNMITSIRNIEKALGSSEKKVTESEFKNIKVARKSIVAKCHIRKGDVFTEESITTKRPGLGMSPVLWDELIGKKAKMDFEMDDLIYE